jgi:hypothetical protein
MEQIDLRPVLSEAEKIRKKLEESHPSVANLMLKFRNSIEETLLETNPDGMLVGIDGDTYFDTPRTRQLIRIAKLINDILPPVPDDHVRLWRGNRNGEVGLNTSYTNSLEGIALPFLLSYNGPLSYIDIPKQDLEKYLCSVGGAPNAEFMLPEDLVKNVHIVGMSDEEATELKSQSKPEEPISDVWTSFRV